MRDIIKKILKEQVTISESDNLEYCKDIMYLENRKYGTKGMTLKMLKKYKVMGRVFSLIKRDSEIDEVCNCCDGVYIKDIKCEDAYIDHLFKKISDQQVGPFLWAKKKCDGIKKPKKPESSGKISKKYKVNNLPLTIQNDDLSYESPSGSEPPIDISFNMYGDLIQESFDLLKPHVYTFKLGEFFELSEDQELSLSNLGKETMNRTLKKIIKKLNLTEWELKIEFGDLSTKYLDGNNIEVNFKLYIKLVTDEGTVIVDIEADATGKTVISLTGEINQISCALDNFLIKGEVKSVVDFDVALSERGILYLKKKFKIFGYGVYDAEIPIDLSDKMGLYFSFNYPVPQKFPFVVILPEGGRTVVASVVDPRIAIAGNVNSYSAALSFGAKAAPKKGSAPVKTNKPTTPKPTTNKPEESPGAIKSKEPEFGVEINEQEDKVIENDITAVLMVYYTVGQKLLNHLDTISAYHKFSDVVSLDSLPLPIKNIWDQLKDTPINLTLSNFKLSNSSETEMVLTGTLTLTTRKLLVSIEKDGDKIVNLQLLNIQADEYVSKSVPFRAKIKIKKEGVKISMNVSSLTFNVHGLFNLGLQDSGGVDVKLKPLVAAGDTVLDYETSYESPLKFNFDIPPVKGTTIKLVIGSDKENYKEISIAPSNQYEINLTENSVNAVTDVKLTKK